MPYDPALPATNSPLQSQVMRDQLQGLKALIDAIQTLAAAQVDSINTLPPGSPATAAVTVDGDTLRFTFGLPQGDAGPQGDPGDPGDPGGPEGPPGPPGEVSFADMETAITDAIASTSNNSNFVDTLGLSVTEPPQQWEVQALADKLDELIIALRR